MITKIFCIDNKVTYDVDLRTSLGENLMVCPVCSANRKKKNDKSFSYNSSLGTGHCCHCNFKFVKHKEMDKEYTKIEYRLPEERKNKLSEATIKWFNKRGISNETIEGLYITQSNEFFPQVSEKRNAICFNYYRHSKLINIKFRDAQKHFILAKDAELILYNLNSIIGKEFAIITEGEMDCASFYEVGIKNVVSVPNGANKKSQNLEFLDNCIDDLEGIKLFYIASDNDEAGDNLAKELIRRLGAENCKRIDFSVYKKIKSENPEIKCKDANDVLINHGKEALLKCFRNAKEIPLSGIYNQADDRDAIIDLWNNGMQKGKGINHRKLNDFITWITPAVAVITGIPSHGKSEFVDEICTQLNVLYNWKIGYYSPENFPIKLHISKLVSKISGKKFSKYTLDEIERDLTMNYIEDNFFLVYPENEDYSLNNILEHARLLIKKKGIKVFVIDPYNKIDHQYEKGETETKYISGLLDKLDSFSKAHDILIILVAHPTKMQKNKEGNYEVPTLYDIAGSAHFYNKCFYGLSIYKRIDHIEVWVQKVKFKHLGSTGMVTFGYHWDSGRYFEMLPEFTDSTFCDTSNYLKIPKKELLEKTIKQEVLSPVEPSFHEPKEKESIIKQNEEFDWTKPLTEDAPF